VVVSRSKAGESIVKTSVDYLPVDRSTKAQRFALRFAFLALFLLAASLGARAQASDVYITPDGTGQGVCTSNPHNPAWFNNSGNWGNGASQIGPGTTVHLCGTFTFAAGATGLTAQGNGASGNPIIILFENSAILQAPNFGGGGAGIRLDNRSFITVDGQKAGMIQALTNGTPGAACLGGPCVGDSGGTGISAGKSSNITIQNLTIRNIYLRASISDLAVNQFANFSIEANPATNLTIRNNVMHDAGNHLATQGNNMTISGNEMYNMDQGLATSYAGAYIFGNHIHDMANWDAPAGCGGNCPYHHDGIHFFQNPGPGYWDNVFIYNNTFDGSPGITAPTGWIFMEATCCTNGHVYVFNNTLTSGPESFPGEMGIYSGASIVVANNTVWGGSFANGGVACDIGHSDAVITLWKNTVCEGQSTTFGIQPDSIIGGGSGAIDYNLVGDGANSGNMENYGYQGNNAQTLTAWRAIALRNATVHDANSQLVPISGMLLSNDGHPQAGSPVIGKGANLTSLCTGGAINALCQDKAGTPRPTSGAWDIGAYQFAAAQGPSQPSGLTAKTQ
jgi:hypothetical protein